MSVITNVRPYCSSVQHSKETKLPQAFRLHGLHSQTSQHRIRQRQHGDALTQQAA